MSKSTCTLWLDREALEGDERSTLWSEHFDGCASCRREAELDRLLAAQRIRVETGFSRAVMRALTGRRRNWAVSAIAASLALMIAAGWGLGATSSGGLGATLLTLFADALTVGWGWLGASWAGVRLALRGSLDPRALVGLALLAMGVGGLTWALLRRRAAAVRHRAE